MADSFRWSRGKKENGRLEFLNNKKEGKKNDF
jgi:hypothetical protein